MTCDFMNMYVKAAIVRNRFYSKENAICKIKNAQSINAKRRGKNNEYMK
jgi:hypothetical protein